MPYSGGQPLHVSELELPDHPGSKEVRMKRGSWMLLLLVERTRVDGFVKASNRASERATDEQTDGSRNKWNASQHLFSSSAAVWLISIRYWMPCTGEDEEKHRYPHVWNAVDCVFCMCYVIDSFSVFLSLLFRSIAMRILPYVWCVFVDTHIFHFDRREKKGIRETKEKKSRRPSRSSSNKGCARSSCLPLHGWKQTCFCFSSPPRLLDL